jgi:hypothetical protein
MHLEAQPVLTDADKAALNKDVREARARARTARNEADQAKKDLSRAAMSRDGAKAEAAGKRLDEATARMEAAQAEERKASEALTARDEALGRLAEVEADEAVAKRVLADDLTNAAEQRAAVQSIEAKEAEIRSLFMANRGLAPPTGSLAGMKIHTLQSEIEVAKKDLAVTIRTGAGMTAERRIWLRRRTPFRGEGGAERMREWLQTLERRGEGKGVLYRDYITGEYLPLSQLSPDHIFPVNDILDLPGFGRLAAQDQLFILDMEANLRPLNRAMNYSKQAAPVDRWAFQNIGNVPGFNAQSLENIKALRDNARQKIEEAIAERLAKTRGLR